MKMKMIVDRGDGQIPRIEKKSKSKSKSEERQLQLFLAGWSVGWFSAILFYVVALLVSPSRASTSL